MGTPARRGHQPRRGRRHSRFARCRHPWCRAAPSRPVNGRRRTALWRAAVNTPGGRRHALRAASTAPSSTEPRRPGRSDGIWVQPRTGGAGVIMPDRRATDRLASFVEEFAFERIPAPVLTRTKAVIYDGLGALLAATSSRYDIGTVLERLVKETGATPESQVFGTQLRTSCATAALVNGTLGYYCDVESHHPGAIM